MYYHILAEAALHHSWTSATSVQLDAVKTIVTSAMTNVRDRQHLCSPRNGGVRFTLTQIENSLVNPADVRLEPDTFRSEARR
ncbi:hypothetical protein EVAR_84954_1 [Eumeta japonica]|uniref:Uncharacterized protein n=1 Tax=Eumeta variegata TaxID=151549 RepID=A0A4C1VI41_EUMVA|nr:hypothetical protein EVAR_84954_1 [Eumeta japonica]